MKRLIAAALSLGLLFFLFACSRPAQPEQPVTAEPTIQPESAGYTANNEEVRRAFDIGIVPESIRGEWNTAITYSQFCELVDRMIAVQNQDLADAWEASAKTAFGSGMSMTRDSGMIGLYVAAKILGIADYRPNTDVVWYELDGKIGEPWKDFCHDYSPFGITRAMKSVFNENEFGYEAAGYFYSLSRVSLVSGKTLFDYDETTNSMRPGDPLTLEEAVCAVLRLYESIYKPAVVSGAILPKENDDDKNIAVYQYLSAGAKNTFFITFGSPDNAYPKAGKLHASYDLMIPKGGENYGGLNIISCISVVDANGVWLNRKNADFEAILREDNGNLTLVEKNGGAAHTAEDKGNYWLFHMDIQSSYAATSAKSYQQLYLENNFIVPENGYAGQIWIDNVKISDKDTALVDYDFNAQYSAPYKEILGSDKSDGDPVESCCLLWGPVSKIGAKQAFNVVKAGLVYEGSPNEENNADLLNGIDPDALFNPGFDFRNFTGVTLRWKADHTFTEQVGAGFDIIVPKALFEGFQSKDAYWLINLAVASADDRDETLYERMIGHVGNSIVLKEDNLGNICPVNGLSNIKTITEYDDCYRIVVDASLEWPETSGKRIWLKVQMTGSEIVYGGYVYLDNWHISSGGNTIINYTVDPEPLPDNLFQMYDHSCNGSYYWWNNVGTGFYYLGFETLNLPK